MIYLENEKNSKLTCEQMYLILDVACKDAEDNGFMNSFVFERALYKYAAMMFYPERKEELEGLNPLTAFAILLKDGTIDKIIDDFKNEIDLLLKYGQDWLEEYTANVHSIRGAIGEFQNYSEGIMNGIADRMTDLNGDDRIGQVLKTATEWGMYNTGNVIPSEPSMFE